jgi:hypothetical protein
MFANLAPILGGPAPSEYGARVVPAGEVKVFTGEPATVSRAVLRRHHCGRLARISCGAIRCALKTSWPPARIGSSRVQVKQATPPKRSIRAIHPVWVAHAQNKWSTPGAGAVAWDHQFPPIRGAYYPRGYGWGALTAFDGNPGLCGPVPLPPHPRALIVAVASCVRFAHNSLDAHRLAHVTQHANRFCV